MPRARITRISNGISIDLLLRIRRWKSFGLLRLNGVTRPVCQSSGMQMANDTPNPA